MTPVLELTSSPDEADLATIGEGLRAFNATDTGPFERLPLAVILRGSQGEVLGGISGYTAWGWLYVQWLWLAESMRGQRWAGRMLALAETEARTRGCHGAWIDTFNPVALAAYKRAGYAEFGKLPEFPRGRSRYFLQKPL
ncbi:GNAT family N-acetyltransferase [Phaeovulum sp.]|uniref:GNAT family N-acetyltransferase n=1 Tax=Phaeovulum sp. TaxID=2934796 RepID=UPI0035669D04